VYKFLFIIILFLFPLLSPGLVFAQSPVQPSVKIEYQLPYPGLLPDSPFYILKTIRDRSVGFLISAPLKKAEFDLMQADKRISAGVYLLHQKKGKQVLAESTMSKGENYFSSAIKDIKQAKKEGRQTTDMLKKMLTASQKYQEIFKELDLRGLEKRAADFEKEVSALILQ